MVWQANVNVGPGDLDLGIYELKEHMKANGFTLQGSGDGDSNFDNAGTDVITHSGSGANGIANTDSWWRIQAPDAQREYVFYRPSGASSWIIRYSQSAGFTGGTPDANTPPTATDEQDISTNAIGGSTDGYYHMAVQDAATGGFYSWWFVGRQPVTSNTLAFCYGEAMTGGPSGDTDPCVHGAMDTASITVTQMDADNANAPFGYFDLGGASEVFTEMPAAGWRVQAGNVELSLDTYYGDHILPVACGRPSVEPAPNVWKGFMAHHKWVCTAPRKYTDIIQDGSSENYLVVDDIGLQGWPSPSTEPRV